MNTLLIVDDESWTRETVKALIEFDSLEITQIIEATNGAEAIKSIKSVRPDFIITDMKMPGIDGIKLLEVLKRDYPEIPAIVLSGYQDFIYTRQAIKSGVIEYLPKPVDENELNEALKKALHEKRKKEQQQIGYQFFILKRPEVESLIEPFRQTLAYSFKELNAAQLSSSMAKLLANIGDELKSDFSLIGHLHQLFFLQLEEMIKEHKLKLEDIGLDLRQLSYQTNSSLETELMNQLEIGKKVILKIDEIRKQKSKINLDDIKQYVDEYFSSPNMSLEIIAKKYFVSKEYLTTAFKKRYGCNVTEYIISSRMEKAKELIMSTTLQYKTIAAMIGYDDVSYFYRVFKKYYGSSPGKIRNN
ncbi:response regulator transcription factor [Metabacillus sediminilitoris]|uniref:Response regulator n=1 Tax=Metabacillus sediminilitoris TaxID=2567941 RepID=A0A4S4BU12_9BACI|nr:response regulator [Metabacillus sediminilitoris]QGQ44941.1 response regulator [Metabacillus sediminilitoris]THF78574.1 response regulator [Metabacillus sediminilitoris]